jgi:hypothetical protein
MALWSFLNLGVGRKVRIHHQASFMLYLESMKAVDRDLRPRDLSDELLAIADAEFDPEWPIQSTWCDRRSHDYTRSSRQRKNLCARSENDIPRTAEIY